MDDYGVTLNRLPFDPEAIDFDFGLRFVVDAIERGVTRVVFNGWNIDHYLKWCAIARASLELGWIVRGVLDRGAPKDHGTGKQYEGWDIIPGQTVRLV